MRVLIIDDDPVVRHILSAVVNGYSAQFLPEGESTIELSVATSGSEGLAELLRAHAEQTLPRAVFLDLQLMDMTGLELLLEAEKALGSALPPIIPMSARPLIELEQKHPERSWALFLQKPFLPDQVIANLKSALA